MKEILIITLKYISENAYLSNKSKKPTTFCIVCGVPKWSYVDQEHCEHNKYIHYPNGKNNIYVETETAPNGRLLFRFDFDSYRINKENKFINNPANNRPDQICINCGYIFWEKSIDSKLNCNCYPNSPQKKDYYKYIKENNDSKDLEPYWDSNNILCIKLK